MCKRGLLRMLANITELTGMKENTVLVPAGKFIWKLKAMNWGSIAQKFCLTLQTTKKHCISFYYGCEDSYLTWKTGDNKQERAWKKWRQETINYRASTVNDYFKNFKHIIEVDYNKVYTFNGWNHTVVDSLDEYCYPNRELGNNLVFNIFRVVYNPCDGKYHLNDIGGTDKVFAATNNEEDAIFIALKYG